MISALCSSALASARRLPGRARPAAAAVASLVALCAGLAERAPAQQFKVPRVELDYDKEVADWKAFKTFSWKDTGQVAEDPAMHTRIVWYVERELEKKGLKKVEPGQGELLVRYYSHKREGLKGTPSQGETTLPGGSGQLTTSVDFKKVVEGTLLVELQRASDQKAIWKASTEVRSIDKERVDADTKSAVRLLIAKFPPPP